MTGTCSSALSWDELVAYWAGDLGDDATAAADEHLMGCASCSAQSARVAQVTETLRAAIPPLLTRAALDHLAAKGLRIREMPFVPGERKEGRFPRDCDLLIFRLGGLDLTAATRVAFRLRTEGLPDAIVETEDAPFDRHTGEVLLACQRHYAGLPPNAVAEVHVRDAAGREQSAEYTIEHVFE
jgi:hypothetical protein